MADKWEEQVKNLKTGEAPESLLHRITTVVPHLAQVAAEEQRPAFWVRFVSEWRYGLVLKVAAFACVAVLGMAAGGSGAQESDLITSLVFGDDIGWESII